MTTTKYTPGPWRVVEQTRIENDDYGFLASLRGEVSPHCKTVTDCNARLISASPDLFAFVECSAAMDCASCDPRYDAKPVLRSHGWNGWNGEENPGVFLARIRRAALEKAVGHYLGRAAA